MSVKIREETPILTQGAANILTLIIVIGLALIPLSLILRALGVTF